MKVLNGIIDEAEFCPSPNFNNRPKGTQVDLIVVHAISLPEGSYNTELIKDFFLNQLEINLAVAKLPNKVIPRATIDP